MGRGLVLARGGRLDPQHQYLGDCMDKSINLEFSDGSKREFVHRGTQADIGVINQIFQKEDYSFKRLRRGQELVGRYNNLLTSRAKPLIVDAGANIGASAVWFSATFPGSHILALEPDRDNFEIALRNTKNLNVDIRASAIGCIDKQGTLVDPGLGEWGYQVISSDGGETNILSMNRLVHEKLAEGYAPYIAKIDIEGGEDDLFSDNAGWIDLFPVLIIELHDWMLPKSGSSRNFLRCIADRNRDFVYVGENIFSIRND